MKNCPFLDDLPIEHSHRHHGYRTNHGADHFMRARQLENWAKAAKAQAIPATLVHVVQGILQPHRLPAGAVEDLDIEEFATEYTYYTYININIYIYIHLVDLSTKTADFPEFCKRLPEGKYSPTKIWDRAKKTAKKTISQDYGISFTTFCDLCNKEQWALGSNPLDGSCVLLSMARLGRLGWWTVRKVGMENARMITEISTYRYVGGGTKH